MLRNKKRFLWMLVWLVIASGVWALDIEITYEHNVRRGIPTDFRTHHPHTVHNSRT